MLKVRQKEPDNNNFIWHSNTGVREAGLCEAGLWQVSLPVPSRFPCSERGVISSVDKYNRPT